MCFHFQRRRPTPATRFIKRSRRPLRRVDAMIPAVGAVTPAGAAAVKNDTRICINNIIAIFCSSRNFSASCSCRRRLRFRGRGTFGERSSMLTRSLLSPAVARRRLCFLRLVRRPCCRSSARATFGSEFSDLAMFSAFGQSEKATQRRQQQQQFPLSSPSRSAAASLAFYLVLVHTMAPFAAFATC